MIDWSMRGSGILFDMATLTVPKPITSNVPSFSSTPYNQANAAFNANQNAFGQFSSNLPTPQQLFTGQPNLAEVIEEL